MRVARPGSNALIGVFSTRTGLGMTAALFCSEQAIIFVCFTTHRVHAAHYLEASLVTSKTKNKKTCESSRFGVHDKFTFYIFLRKGKKLNGTAV